MWGDHLGKSFSKTSSKVFSKKGDFKNFVKLTGKHLCWSHFLVIIMLESCESRIDQYQVAAQRLETCQPKKLNCLKNEIFKFSLI